MRRLFLLCTFLLGLSIPASATTYYTATTGSDGNSCVAAQSTSTPKATINAGGACLSAGDTLLVRGGTYNESISDPSWASGTSWSNKVRIAAYPGSGCQPAIRGTSNCETVWMKPSAGPAWVISIANGTGVHYIEFDGINLDDTNATNPAANMGGWAVYSSGYGGVADHIRLQNAEINGNTVSGDNQSSSIAVDWLGINVTTANEAINLVIHGAAGSNSSYGFYIHTSGNLVDSTEIYARGQSGLQVYEGGGCPDSNTIRKTKIHDITTSYDGRRHGMIICGTNTLIYDNVVWNINGGTTLDHGIYIFSGSGHLVYNNTVSAVSGVGGGNDAGIHVEAGTSNNQLINNISWANSGTVDILDSGTSTTNTTNLCGTTSSITCSVTSNPLFVTAGSDFHLTASSPAINAGTTESKVPDDLDGNSRPQSSAYDIGAYEFVPGGGNAPGTPVLVSPGLHSVNQHTTSVTLSCTATNATSYTLFGPDTFNPPTTNHALGGTCSFNATNLIASKTYYWQIQAVNASGTNKGSVWDFGTQVTFVNIILR